jgi:uncharacterized membrane protein
MSQRETMKNGWEDTAGYCDAGLTGGACGDLTGWCGGNSLREGLAGVAGYRILLARLRDGVSKEAVGCWLLVVLERHAGLGAQGLDGGQDSEN